MTLTSSCISNDSPTSINTGSINIPKVITETIYNTNVTDLDFKSSYSVAVAVFTIFFLIFLAVGGFLMFKFIKNRKIFKEKQDDVTRLEMDLKKWME